MAETEVERRPINYGYDPAGGVAQLALQAENYGAQEIQRIEEEIQGHLDCVNAVRKLKAAIVKASSEGSGAVDFNNNKELKAAYEEFSRLFGEEEADILPKGGIVEEKSVPDLLRVIDTSAKQPTMMIEYCMTIGLVRKMNDLDVMVDCAKDIIKSNADMIRRMLSQAKT